MLAPRVSGGVDVATCRPMDLNPFSWEFHADPYPTYRWLREHAPVCRIDGLDFWARRVGTTC